MPQPAPIYECPTMFLGVYSSSRYFSSSSVNSLPRASSASSILFTELNPIMGDVTRLLIQASATELMLQPCFLASSSTRSIVFLSASICGPVVYEPACFSPSERIVSPYADAGRAKWPRQRGAHCAQVR